MHTADTSIIFDSHSSTLTISHVRGDEGIVPKQRTWTVVFRGVARSTVLVDGVHSEHTSYDPDTLSLKVQVGVTETDRDIVLSFPQGLHLAENPIENDLFNICNDAQIAYSLKEGANWALEGSGIRALTALRTMSYESKDDKGQAQTQYLPESVIAALEEVLLRS
jgi:hypothetical protein